MIRQFTAFRTSDGKTFDNKSEADAWERSERLLEALLKLMNIQGNKEGVREALFLNWKLIRAVVAQPLEERLPTEEKK